MNFKIELNHEELYEKTKIIFGELTNRNQFIQYAQSLAMVVTNMHGHQKLEAKYLSL